MCLQAGLAEDSVRVHACVRVGVFVCWALSGSAGGAGLGLCVCARSCTRAYLCAGH